MSYLAEKHAPNAASVSSAEVGRERKIPLALAAKLLSARPSLLVDVRPVTDDEQKAEAAVLPNARRVPLPQLAAGILEAIAKASIV